MPPNVSLKSFWHNRSPFQRNVPQRIWYFCAKLNAGQQSECSQKQHSEVDLGSKCRPGHQQGREQASGKQYQDDVVNS